MTDFTAYCSRCGELIKLDPLPGSKAKMLKRSSEAKGLCLNCAVHDWLRNTYPPNILLAQSGPKVLLFKHIQEQFFGIMKSQFADAKPNEIDWQKIVDNWNLPFPNKIKRTGMNPVNQKELDEIKAGKRNVFESHESITSLIQSGKGTIRSFEELNQEVPGLGDRLKKALRG